MGLLSLALALPLGAATSVSQFGITWTFDQDYPVGQYANGDYYVVGPIKVVQITPASTSVSGRVINGSVINPASDPNTLNQGFDSAMYGAVGAGSYIPAMNAARPGGNDLSVSNPMIVPVNSSIVSTISDPTPNARPQLTDAAILTVVAVAPPSGSFRPPPYGADKSGTWNKSDLNYNVLRSLAPIGTPPSLSTLEATFLRPRLEYAPHSFFQNTAPLHNGPNYGREIAWEVGDAVLSLHLNYTNAQKEKLFIEVVQYGIDIYGAASRSNGVWADRAGILIGRKLPLVLAALALNDSGMKDYADAAKHFIFAEDRETFMITQSDVGRAPYLADGEVREPYLQQDVGLAEFGQQHASSPQYDGRNWETLAYRDIFSGPGVSTALAAQLLAGGVAAWNWSPFFLYEDRYFPLRIEHGAGSVAPLPLGMWPAYRSLAPISAPPTNVKISIEAH